MTISTGKQGSALSNLQLRVISAAILGSVALAATWYGGMPFRVMAALIGLLVFWEWQNITGYDKYGLLELAAPASVAASVVLVILNFPALESVIPAIFAVMFSVAACVRRGVPYWFPFGVPYAILPVLGLCTLRADHQSGLATVVFLFSVVWAADIFAYVAGRTFGGPKLAPKISPKKTVSGALGGALAGIIVGIGIAAWFGQSSWWYYGILALILTVCSQVGDLFESYVKRRFGVKDSGTIIPGHGGVMDRVDGLIAATVALYFYSIIMIFSQSPSWTLFPL